MLRTPRAILCGRSSPGPLPSRRRALRLAEFLKEAAAGVPDWSEADGKAAERFFAPHHGEVSKHRRGQGRRQGLHVRLALRQPLRQAVDFYKKFYPPGAHDAFIAMVRHALTDKYADMAGLPKSVLDAAAKPIAAGHDVVGGIAGGLLGGGAKKAVGVNPYKEIVGIASKGFNEVQKFALTHDQDDQPQMHQELHDNR